MWMLCGCDIEDREDGVGVGTNGTELSVVMNSQKHHQVMRLAESSVREFWL